MKKKTHKVTLEFDNKSAAANFFASWLDGGLDGGGNIDWHTDKWDKKNTYMRISGTGYGIEWDGENMIVMTPKNEKKIFKARMKQMGVKS